MSNINKTLIIGNSNIIKKTFTEYFKNSQLDFIAFRKIWNTYNKVCKYDNILISGFHYEICNKSIDDLNLYIKEYYKLIHELKKNNKRVYMIFTDLNFKYSSSRVVYFYDSLLKLLKSEKDIKIISFPMLNENKNNFLYFLKIRILKFLNIEVIEYMNLLNNLENFIVTNYDFNIKYLFIKFKRSRKLDSYVRLIFDYLIYKKIFNLFIKN